jgi:hypothetical protein
VPFHERAEGAHQRHDDAGELVGADGVAGEHNEGAGDQEGDDLAALEDGWEFHGLTLRLRTKM